jgi:hypothetical protein
VPDFVVLHDRELFGGVPARKAITIIKVDGSVPLRHAFHGIRAAAGTATGKRLHTLFVLCHGFAGSNKRAGMSMDAGGEGLLLGKERLLHSNVGMWSEIRNTTANIVIYACAAADTQPNNEGTDADGKYLMGALALHTSSDVYAADKIQWYSRYQRMARGMIDFGRWEGGLWRFPATGTRPQLVSEVPIPLSQVMNAVA